MQALPGFRDFYPEDAARRAAITGTWRAVARAHGFDEYDGPTLESLDLYAKKNAGGEEILGQLYKFEDGGGRGVALRPELTPTLARMVAAREKHYRKPLKWFAAGPFFRYERQQRGRLREFLQFNCDILGDASPEADAELVSLATNSLRAFGFTSADIVVRLSHRGAWARFLRASGVADENVPRVLAAADKLERERPEALEEKLAGTGISVGSLRAFISGPPPDELGPVIASLRARGLGDFVEVDLSIVRGLAYYTGIVFEIFDRAKSQRALAGGGRYDRLVKDLSEGACDIPAVGFGMGDVVLANLIADTPAAAARLAEACKPSCDAYIVIADPARRPEALALAQQLRDEGLRCDFPLSEAKVGKQFQAAEAAGARVAAIVGAEWPNLRLKNLATREEREIPHGALAEAAKTICLRTE